MWPSVYDQRTPAVPGTVVKWHVQELLHNKDLNALHHQCLPSNSSVFCIYLVPPAVQRAVRIPALGMFLCVLYCLPFPAGDKSTPEPVR